jgi:diadenosine tetraphosphate (Ap4A) HIT family hydrolase
MSVFSTIPTSNWVFETDHFYAIYDMYPTSEGHLLIISKRLSEDFFSLVGEERQDLLKAIQSGKDLLDQRFQPNGYNIGMNCGKDSGQTIFHFHCHLIPRYTGDVDDPRGGVRHSVIGKGYY